METIVSLLVGGVLPFIMNGAKKVGVPAKTSIVLIALAMGGAYTVFEFTTPVEIKTNVYSLFAQTLTTSFLIYEFILKAKPISVKKKK